MKIAVLSGQGRGAYLAYKLKKEGHDVEFHIIKPQFRGVWEGIDVSQTEKMPDPKRAELVVFDSVGGGKTADRFASGGSRVVGGCSFLDELCSSKEFAEVTLQIAEVEVNREKYRENDPELGWGFWILPAAYFCFNTYNWTKMMVEGLGATQDFAITGVVNGVPVSVSQHQLARYLQSRGVTGFVYFSLRDVRFVSGVCDLFWAWFATLECSFTDLFEGKIEPKHSLGASFKLSCFPFPAFSNLKTSIVGLTEQDLQTVALYNVWVENGLFRGSGELGCFFKAGESYKEVYDSLIALLARMRGTEYLQVRVEKPLAPEQQGDKDEQSEENPLSEVSTEPPVIPFVTPEEVELHEETPLAVESS
jgi:hypothetical protein